MVNIFFCSWLASQLWVPVGETCYSVIYLLLSLICTVLSLHLSVLTAIFPDRPGLADTRMSPFWILSELRMMEVVVTAGAIRHPKLQSYHPYALPVA